MIKLFLILTQMLSSNNKQHKDYPRSKRTHTPQSEQVYKSTEESTEEKPVFATTAQLDERELISTEHLETVIRRCTVFIDTCELLHEKFPALLYNMTPFLKKYGKKLTVPSGVEAELKNLFFKKPELQEKIMNVIILLNKKKDEGLVEICGQAGVTFADQQILTIATGSLLSDEAVFITRDSSLSEDILKLNNLASVQGKKVSVYRISKYGFLTRYKTAAERVKLNNRG